MEKKDGKKFRVLCQKWEESERGWGTRPDGFSLHLSEADRAKYLEEHWARMPDRAPDEYSRPDGTAYWCEVDKKTYDEIVKSKCGIREFRGPYPGNGGTDGWKSLQGGGQGKK